MSDNGSYSNSGFDEDSILSLDVQKSIQEQTPGKLDDSYEDDFDSPAPPSSQKVANASNVTEYDDDFDSDEENEKKVERDVRIPAALITGQRVEARHGGQSQWYGAMVANANASSGKYDLDYDDGDQEKSVRRYRIRIYDSEQMLAILHVGDEVDAFHGGGTNLYSGKIGKLGAGNTYDIHYDDGDQEFGIARHLVFGAYFQASESTTSLVPSSTRGPSSDGEDPEGTAASYSGDLTDLLAAAAVSEPSEAEKGAAAVAAAAQNAVVSTQPPTERASASVGRVLGKSYQCGTNALRAE
jgi:hypothetical protein